MKAIYRISTIKKHPKNIVLVIGVFDGVHRGHQKLIKQAVKRARVLGGKAYVLTFHPHPIHVLYPQHYQPLITSMDYRLKLLTQLGIDSTVVVAFTKAFARVSAEKFTKDYLVNKIHPKEIFVGDDFRFGQNRTGTLDYFADLGEKYGFKVNGVHTLKKNAKKIGSTAIRELIAQGNLKKAEKLLTRKVSLLGRVTKGDGRGKTLGFPTANIALDGEVLLPPIGVYAANVIYKNRKYKAMVNIGHCPTFRSSSQKISCEVHIFSFHSNLYGKEIITEFVKKIRDEKHFPSAKALQVQLQKDKEQSLRVLSSS